MAGLSRAFHYNLIYNDPAETFLTASSSDPSLPVSNLLDPLLSKVWRSGTGWTVVEFFNDAIDLEEGGVARLATIVPGTYATAAEYDLAVQTALNDAAIDNVYSVTARVIQRTSGSTVFSLRWATGSRAWHSAGRDLGFDTSADDTGGTTYFPDSTVYQGQQAVTLERAIDAIRLGQVAAVLNHNLVAGAVVMFQGFLSSPGSGDPSFEIELTGDGEEMRAAVLIDAMSEEAWLECAAYRWVFRNGSNPEGFTEAGIVWVGPMAGPSVRPSINFREMREELSEIVQAIDGAIHSDERPMRRVLDLEWLEIVPDDVAILEGIADDNPRGRCHFWNWDADDLADTWYGYFSTGLTIDTVPANYNTVTTQFVEALG